MVIQSSQVIVKLVVVLTSTTVLFIRLRVSVCVVICGMSVALERACPSVIGVAGDGLAGVACGLRLSVVRPLVGSGISTTLTMENNEWGNGTVTALS